MKLYEYKCDVCHSVWDDTTRADFLDYPCPFCESGTPRRVWKVSFRPIMQEHFNRTVGKGISDERQFARELRKQGDQYTEKTGMEVDYQPLSQGDMKKMMTMEGMDSTNRVRRAQGLPAIEV